jgi:hypothetical protein
MKVDVGDGLSIDITLNRTGNPPGKLADATLYFTQGPLAGLCVLGFGIWERREKPNEINVTMPSRQFMAKGERRSFNLVRIDHDHDPAAEDTKVYYAPLDALRRRFVRAYTDVVSAPPSTDETTPPDDDIGF